MERRQEDGGTVSDRGGWEINVRGEEKHVLIENDCAITHKPNIMIIFSLFPIYQIVFYSY